MNMLRKFKSLFFKSDIDMTFNPIKVKINGLQYYLRKADSSDLVNICLLYTSDAADDVAGV